MRRIVFALALCVTTYLFLTPLEHVPPGPVNSDKVVHALLFVGLALLGRHARLPAVPLGLGLVAYAIGTEVLQHLLPIHRHGDVLDVLADATGIAVGLLASRLSGAGASAPGPQSPR